MDHIHLYHLTTPHKNNAKNGMYTRNFGESRLFTKAFEGGIKMRKDCLMQKSIFGQNSPWKYQEFQLRIISLEMVSSRSKWGAAVNSKLFTGEGERRQEQTQSTCSYTPTPPLPHANLVLNVIHHREEWF